MLPAAPTCTDPAGPSDEAQRAGPAPTGPPVLGLGGTVDYVVDFDEQTVQALVDRYCITAGELHRYAPIEDERSLLVSLLAFVATGTGGERFVASPQVVRAFAAHFPIRVELGGTCVRASLALDRLGRRVRRDAVRDPDHRSPPRPGHPGQRRAQRAAGAQR
jgi:hypothetical protein